MGEGKEKFFPFPPFPCKLSASDERIITYELSTDKKSGGGKVRAIAANGLCLLRAGIRHLRLVPER